VEDQLDGLARNLGIDRENERTYDSGDFPKVIFADQVITPADAADPTDAVVDICGGCAEPLIEEG
jgi:hypothetical protein